MYPFLRMANEIRTARKVPELTLGETHVTRIRIWPWDIDPFMELNNGRVLTLMDLGRFGLFGRMNAIERMKAQGWYGAVAGSMIRYRRRITVFQKLELRTRILGWDDRFIYVEHGLWRGDECCAHAALRLAISGGKGIIPTAQVAEVFDLPSVSPVLPNWVQAWSAAEANRPWPPEY